MRAYIPIIFTFCVALLFTSGVSLDFKFNDFILGDWDIQRSQISTSPGSEQIFDELVGKLVIAAENGTTNLIGSYFENDTLSGGLIQNEVEILIEMVDTDTGSWKIGEEHIEKNIAFDFAFLPQKHDVILSFGEINFGINGNQAENGYYQFIVIAADKFILNIFNPENKENTIYTAKRIPPASEPTFFGKYGTTIMIIGFIAMQFFVQRKTQRSIQDQQENADKKMQEHQEELKNQIQQDLENQKPQKAKLEEIPDDASE